jgi:DNA polymerase-3 subunit delta
MADPLPSTVLVLVAGGGTVPQALSKLATSVGGLVDTTVGIGRARSQWLADHLRDGPVRLDAAAAARLGNHLGGDMGRLSGLLDTLAAAYGPGASVHVDELEPFLGEVGSAAPWDLTDAIDGGDIPGALDALHRLLGAGSHPLQVMASLHTHYRRMLVLDGAGVTSQEAAAELLGTKPYPAKKAMTQGRRLGSAGVARAFRLLAAADLDLRGGTAMPGETVLDVLVARLSQRVGPSR